MRPALAALCGLSLLAASAGAFAQRDRSLTDEQKLHLARMKACNQQAGARQGEDRKAYIEGCASGAVQGAKKGAPGAPAGPNAALVAQQNKMKDCSKKAAEKKLKDAERQKFMSACLKAKP